MSTTIMARSRTSCRDKGRSLLDLLARWDPSLITDVARAGLVVAESKAQRVRRREQDLNTTGDAVGRHEKDQEDGSGVTSEGDSAHGPHMTPQAPLGTIMCSD